MPQNKKIDYKVIKRKIKYPRLELKTGKLVIVIPHNGDLDVPEFISKHKDWIESKQKLIKKYSQKNINLRKRILTREDFKKIIGKSVDKFREKIKVKPNMIIIKEMKRKWGSCSSNKNLCFNLLLSRLPDRLIEYVVYHEMCHLKNRKHDEKFKILLKKQYNDPDKCESKLFCYWFALNKNS